MNTSLKLGKLWIVATPIGNHGDFSPRAREVLSRASLVLAEDTRRAGKLMADSNVSTAGFSSFHDHNEEEKLPLVLERLKEGEELALISDAGTPLLSDPGYRLVKACREQGIPVSPVPGPSAPIVALSASGLPPLPFIFLGFPPRKDTSQESFFLPYAHLSITLIFFERKDRLSSTLSIAFAMLGERDVCIARELTKTYEEFITFPLSSYTDFCRDLKGEITVIIGPPKPEQVKSSEELVIGLLKDQWSSGSKPKDAAKYVQNHTTGWSVKEIYALLEQAKR